MIEIKTQGQFNNINTLIANSPIDGELIRIHDLGNNKAYQLNQTIMINRSNVNIEGYGASKPIIQANGSASTEMIRIEGNSSLAPIDTICIKNISLKGNSTFHVGIVTGFVGKSYTAGLTSGTYSRYDSSTVGKSYICKKGVTIENCIIQNTLTHNIFLQYTSNSIIKNNIFKNSTTALDTNTSIRIFSGSSNIIGGNTFQNSSIGILVDVSSSNIIPNNIIFGGTNGIKLSGGKNNVIPDNIIQKCTIGISSHDSSHNNIISNNTIKNSGNYGINMIDVSSSIINKNIIIDTNNSNGTSGSAIEATDILNSNISNNQIMLSKGTGIYIKSTANSKNTTITDNIVQNNLKGIVTDSKCDKILLYGNTCTSNTTSNYEIGGTNIKHETQYNK